MTRLTPGRRLSISAYGTYLDCPAKWDYVYLQRRRVAKRETPQHMRFGNVIHEGMERAYHALVDRRLSGSLEQVIPDGMAGVRNAWTKYDMPTEGGELDRALGMIQETLAWLTDDYADVVGIEHKFLIYTPGGTPFIGFADLLRRANDETIEVRDYKVKKKISTTAELQSDVQANMYAHAAQRQFPWARQVRFSHLYPNHGPHYVAVDLTADGISEALDRFDVVGGMIEQAESFPPRVSDTCDYCDHRDVCPAWQKPTDPEPDVFDQMVDF